MPLLLLPFILILLSLFSLFRNRSQRSIKESQDSFWEKEQRANLTRKQDISGLDYIQIPLDTFPTGKYADETLAALEQTLNDLSSRKILNLSGISNTDLKLQYGAANLNILSDCDANFTTLARTVVSYGEQLARLGHWQEAITVLEFGILCKTDMSKNYTLLGSLYQEHGKTEKLEELAETVKGTDMLLKDSILRQLQNGQ
ncbi:MAG: hypothetical protein K2N87_01325 [Eubacterium sp.]|nr:hypothetical protein [Eubacterium sp.]